MELLDKVISIIQTGSIVGLLGSIFFMICIEIDKFFKDCWSRKSKESIETEYLDSKKFVKKCLIGWSITLVITTLCQLY